MKLQIDIERLKKDPEALDRISEYNILEIKQAIKLRRKKMGLTQNALANIVGTNQPTISVIENPNKTDISLKSIMKVASAIGCVISIKLQTKHEAIEALETAIA